MKPLLFSLCALCGLTSLEAARTSTDYSIPAETLDSAGGNAQTTDYAVHGNAAGEFGAGGDAIVSSPDYTGKGGYVGQLYELVSLSVAASPTTVNETASRQLAASAQADDATTLAALDSSTVAWSVVNGPIVSISAGGLATAGNVYQDTAATVGGTAQSLTGQLGLTVVNVGFDDFGPYSGDQIDDAWQVQYFGSPPNPNAAPGADPDRDGQDNLFEFTAGLIPNDPSSRFVLKIQSVLNQPAQRKVLFSPLVSGRTYTVQSTPLVSPSSWTTLTGTTQSDNGNERTVTDLNATSTTRSYRVRISRP